MSEHGYPTLYEINTRPWIKQFGKNKTLSDIPDKYWKHLKSNGVDFVWLMGVWETSQDSINKHCFHPDLINAYNNVSNEWTDQDITGSPYAIEDYVVSHLLGKPKDLRYVRSQLNRLGLKLILDFVPNHFNAHSRLITVHPEIFLQSRNLPADGRAEYFFTNDSKHFAHGKDPYFAPWSDTVQIDYFSAATHTFMCDKLAEIANLCDGLRCDMAMLILPDIFSNTWAFLAREHEVQADFWSVAITKTKQEYPEFIFLAEAYWDTQWRLQQLGFDYTYDKKIIDFLKEYKTGELRAHLSGTMEYQNRCVRFIENHDEERSISSLGDERSKAGAILLMTLPGMRLHFDGQWTGHRTKYPVQLGTYFRPHPCPCGIKSMQNKTNFPCPCTSQFYDKLLGITKHEIFKKGSWRLLDCSSPNIIANYWQYQGEERLSIINLGTKIEECRIELPEQAFTGNLIDLLSEEQNPSYAKRKDQGLEVSLPASKGCILK